MTTTAINPSVMTRTLRKQGISVPVKAVVDYYNDGISYMFTGEISARFFAEDLRAAGYEVKTFRARVTIVAVPSTV